MDFRLGEIGSAIFCGTEMYLDLDTGRVFPCRLVEQKVETLPEHCAKLPCHSANFVPHCYIYALLKSDPAALEFVKNSCPVLEELQNAYPNCDERVFAKVSGEFCDAYSKIIGRTREHSPEETTAKMPTYGEFYRAICRKFAIEWCEKNGIKVKKK